MAHFKLSNAYLINAIAYFIPDIAYFKPARENLTNSMAHFKLSNAYLISAIAYFIPDIAHFNPAGENLINSMAHFKLSTTNSINDIESYTLAKPYLINYLTSINNAEGDLPKVAYEIYKEAGRIE